MVKESSRVSSPYLILPSPGASASVIVEADFMSSTGLKSLAATAFALCFFGFLLFGVQLKLGFLCKVDWLLFLGSCHSIHV